MAGELRQKQANCEGWTKYCVNHSHCLVFFLHSLPPDIIKWLLPNDYELIVLNEVEESGVGKVPCNYYRAKDAFYQT
jgi:hypothetical protein